MAKYYEKQSKSQNAASLASTHLAFHNNLLSIKSVMESFPLRFFHHPMPALHQPSSRLACPCRRRVGFSVFRINNGGGLGPVYSPMAKCPRDLTLKQINQPCTFGLSLSAHLAYSYVTKFIDSSHMLTIPPSLAPFRVVLADAFLPHGIDLPRKEDGLLCSVSFTPPCYQNRM